MLKFALLALVLSAVLFFGCTQQEPAPNADNEISGELDSIWIEDTDLSMENPIATESDAVAAEAGKEMIDEDEEISIGEMI